MTHPANDPHPDHRLSLERIERAQHVIDSVFLGSAQFESDELNARLGRQVSLKDETQNPIRSFKGRGADFFLREITERGDDRELVCASTGNFGQAMAWAASKRDRNVVVYADVNANPIKTGRISELGGEVRLAGSDFDEAKSLAREYCEANDAWMVEDGREPEISEGAGTIAVEMATGPEIDSLLVPVGNGALINGVGRWLKAVSPGTRIIGVSATTADAMALSWRSGELVERPTVETIAEGIAVRIPVTEAVADMEPLVGEMLLVSDEQMIEAMRLLHETTGFVVEPSGAVGVAALLNYPTVIPGEMVATILTGSNLTEEQRRTWLW